MKVRYSRCFKDQLLKFFKIAGISGAKIKIDKNGDSEGNFSVLALKQGDFSLRENFTCSFNMKPVAHFEEGDEFPVSCPPPL